MLDSFGLFVMNFLCFIKENLSSHDLFYLFYLFLRLVRSIIYQIISFMSNISSIFLRNQVNFMDESKQSTTGFPFVIRELLFYTGKMWTDSS